MPLMITLPFCPVVKCKTILIKEGEAQSLTFYNEPLANLTIYKVDSTTGKPLANAQFMVTDQDR